jgi:hypothetical protein
MAESNRYVVEEMWDWVERYIAPYRGRFFKDERSESSVEWRRPWVYDATAVMSAQHLASSLHSSLTSPSIRWFDLRFKQDELNDNDEAREWLEECAKVVYTALQDSNFNVEINETYQDMVDFGTSALVEEIEMVDGKEELVFRSVPLKEFYFDQDHRGRVLNFYRKLEWTPLQIVNRFGKDGVPKELVEEIESDGYNNDKKYVVIFGIYRRNEVSLEETRNKVALAPEKRPYGWRYVMERDATPLGEEGGYYEMPAFVPRWRTTSSSMWGNSPGMLALSDTMTLNRYIELNMVAAEKALDPPTLTSQRGLIGDLDLNAGGLTVCRDINELTVFESKARFDVTYQEMQRLQMNIKEYFFINQLMLPPMEGTPPTATEIGARMAQLERLIGPTLGRIQSDLLDPIVSRTFRIEFRRGNLPEMPDVVAELGGRFEVEYTGPMAKTQEASQVSGVERWLTLVGGMAQLNPEVLDVPDWDEIVKQVGQNIGVSAKLMKPTDELIEARAERAAKQQMMEQAQMMQEMGAGQQAMEQGGGM